MDYVFLIPMLPLLSFLIILFTRPIYKKAGIVGTLFTGAAFLCSLIVLFSHFAEGNYIVEANWFSLDTVIITVGLEVNPLNALMLVIVTLVSFLVHIYSMGYMANDERYATFFSYLGLFTFSMTGLVLSPNLLQLYMFWELVGVCSFLLVGFYFYKPEAKAAAKKAFIMTRIGDIGLLVAIFLLFWQTGSFELDVIFEAAQAGDIAPSLITLIAILIFVGAVGKSGQFPLHTWLPDAMEGPTPVSALIHAATMVAAGVYLVAVTYPLFSVSEVAMTTVAVTGGFTAIFAATIALVQTDIKRILAYSTVSQLGYMMLALGAAGYTAGVFHLTTHAFFKALLFLAAGSVIHAVHEQNIFKMGGLSKKLPITATLFLIASLSISGFPLLAGFFSKDEILATTYGDGRYVLFAIGLITAFLTAFYMFRLYFLVFSGNSSTEARESPSVMLIPMMVLGALAIVGGYIQTNWFGTFLGDWLETTPYSITFVHHEAPFWLPILASVLSIGGIALAWMMYVRKTTSIKESNERTGLHELLYRKYYVDELYQVVFVKGSRVIAYFWMYVDRFIIEGGAAVITGAVKRFGQAGVKLQSGQVQTYGTVAFSGLVLVLLLIAVLGGYF
ncbi:NADH-quinone oxidoreductase subunit L [Pseudalkalibacillus hwajinpoensis]|uniref:NADH-quinone oxidoreductase subunit L n=1 Tax=Guptibacillus hwajinpoensis TaxID=208199 RepID=A0A4U1MIN1_9BACL|nr:NADH-quinone oxidoreductase subunit L [Pseudalkalibacillus hwajinpoensis]TKD70647.1 NADH-quinone oxidoreductase subunit L [Pseudalkalibacillus hwajinpoensis]